MKASFFCRGHMALALAVLSLSARAQGDGPGEAGSLLNKFPPTNSLLDKIPPTNGAAARPAPPPSASTDETDAKIAQWTANAVQVFQYTRHPFDAEISGRFLDRYLEALDYNHVFFLQSDLNEFEKYRSNLQVYTLQKHDISPAHVIFARFLERAGEREAYETNLLATEHFEFGSDERFVQERQRHDLPYPKDLAEATNLWREEVRFEYLDEKLAQKLEYKGPVDFGGESNLTVSLTRRTNWTSFEFLPRKFEDARGQDFGSLEVSPTGTNATVRLRIAPGGNLLKITNHFFGEDGKELGSIRFERTPETNNSAAAPAGASEKKYDCVIESKEKDTAKIVSTLRKRYAQLLKNYHELTNDGHVLEIYLTALARAYDPHSDYFAPAEAENFKIRMQLSLIGIGAKLMQTDADRCKIDSLIPGGPAEQSGQLTNNDIIVAVAQEDQEPVEVDGKPLQEVVDMIRGPEGTPVTLTIEPANSSVRQKVVTLIRNKVKLVDEESKAWMFETPAKIGVINVPSFYAETEADRQDAGPSSGSPHELKTVTTDVAALVNRLKKEKAGGIILDLRANGGGYLDEAIKLTGLFIGKGPVVQTKSPNGEILTDNATNAAPLYDGPLIVLTSRLSASASEILAGALQDYGRAVIVGDKTTFGKGTVQTVQSLAAFIPGQHPDTSPKLGSLHLTIKKFYRASGLTTESNGVAADIVLPSVLTYANLSESSQPNWLPADTVSSADLPPNLNLVKPYLPELLKRSLARREASKDFAYLEEDIAEYRKSQDDRSLSMNEAARLKEQQERDARMEARKAERAARPKPDEKFYDLTLKNVSQPELTPHKVEQKPAPSADAEPTATEADQEDPLTSDPILTEARHIMADYISLMKKPLAAENSR